MDHLPERCRSCGMPCLEKVDFLKGLPENVLEEIFRETSQKQYQAGETLFRETERAEAIYLLHEGKVKLSCWNAEGREQIIGIFSAGEVIWENLFAQNSRYPFTAVCLTQVRACRMPREAVRRAAARPEVAVRVIDLLSRKLQDANERNRMLSVQDPERRLVGFLLYRAEQERSATLVLRLSDISGSIGLRPETVSRKIHALEEKHLIEKTGQSRIRLLNSEQLKRLYVGE